MLIVGTGGHAMDTLDVLMQSNTEFSISFFNNIDLSFTFGNEFLDEFKILRSTSALKAHFEKDPYFILGIGNPKNREYLYKLMIGNGGIPFNLISKKASVGIINNSIGNSVSIMHGVVVTINSIIGDGTLINTNATLTHDAKIGAFVEIGPGVIIAGNVTIKDHAFIGSGATILPNITIGEHSIVAAGSVVVNDVLPYTMVAGNPAICKKALNQSL